jgi:cytochrome c biogenesis protein CcdA
VAAADTSSVVLIVGPLVATAFAAGVVATFNPCGFAMLPAYLGIFLTDREGDQRSALLIGGAVSAGFVAIFTVAGLLVAFGLRAVIAWIPWLALLVGIGLVVVGMAELRGAHIFAGLPTMKEAPGGDSVLGLFGFGASFGVASLSCTLPIFLSLIAGVVAGTSFGESMAVFVAYGAGMSLVVIVLTLALAAGRDRVLAVFRPIGARLGVISGWILIAAGAFIVWYWATVLSVGAEELGSFSVIRTVEMISGWVARTVEAEPVFTAVAAAVVGLAAWLLIRSRPSPTDDEKATVGSRASSDA